MWSVLDALMSDLSPLDSSTAIGTQTVTQVTSCDEGPFFSFWDLPFFGNFGTATFCDFFVNIFNISFSTNVHKSCCWLFDFDYKILSPWVILNLLHLSVDGDVLCMI